MNTVSPFTQLSDTDLLAEAQTLAAHERCATARLVAALAEVDARRLYLPQGCRSMFTYCTEVLHLSEYAAYSRIEAARAAGRFPYVLSLLEQGAITLTTVGLLASHLTEENHERLLASATRKSKRQVEALVAALKPQPPVPTVVRKLPSSPLKPAPQSPLIADGDRYPTQTAHGDETSAPRVAAPPAMKPAIIAPLSPERYKLQLTMSRDTHDKLRRVQDLMRHTNPKGDPAVIFDRAITMLLNSLEKARLGATDRPRRNARTPSQTSRHVPAAVKREVSRRDRGRCAFVGDAGRCCRAHNGYEAEQWFGPLIAREAQSAYESPNWVRT
jgi:hypothetical protein